MANQLLVLVSIPPLADFVHQVGGDRVQVHTLLQPGQNPVTYSPTPQQIQVMARARIYFRIGVPFERSLVPRLAAFSTKLRIIDLRKRIGPAAQAGPDPHIWLDPNLVMGMADTIRDQLCALDPDGEPVYRDRCARFQKELSRLDQRLREILSPVQGKTLMVFHPAYGWFCRAYGLRQQAVLREGKPPGPRGLARLIDQARAMGVQGLIMQPQFSRHTAQSMARAMNVQLVELDPLARDYSNNMIHMASTIRQLLTQDP